MKPITAKRIIRILHENGFIVSRQRGSHMIWKNPQSGIIVPVPLHGKNKPILIGTLHAIIKQSKISPEKFK